jgi:hypothetical protein
MVPDGNTALYDALALGITTGLQVHRKLDEAVRNPVLTYIICLTDGEDTSSTMSLSQCQEVHK